MNTTRLMASAPMIMFLSACVSASYPELYTPPLPEDVDSYSRHPTQSFPGKVVEVTEDNIAGEDGHARGVATTTQIRIRHDGHQPSPMEQVNIAAHDSQIDYSEGYQISARQMDESQLPIIAAAGLASLVLFQNPGSAREFLAGIGVGTGVYSSARNITLPRRMPELYILGHSALGCIRAETAYFTGPAASNAHDALDREVLSFTTEVSDARQIYATTSIDPSEPQDRRTAFQAAMIALNEAIVAAVQALNNANRQLTAFARADSVFAGAVADVHVRVATKARDGRVVEFSQLRQAYTQAIQDAGVPSAASTTAPAAGGGNAIMGALAVPVLDPVEVVRRKTNDILADTQILNSLTPDYSGSLTRVAACSATIQ